MEQDIFSHNKELYMTTQDKLFLQSEGNCWFNRNAKELSSKEKNSLDHPINMIKAHNLKPKNVLEIGCSNGWRLGRIHDEFGSICVGIEPSENAINEGKKIFPDIEFRRGIAANLPVKEDEKFDLVIVNYVLHWISRESLMKSISEIDRIVKDGGHLIIGDFFPDSPARVPYHHLPEKDIYTFKLDYPKIFLSTATYAEVDKEIYAHGDKTKCGTDISSNIRSQCCLLKKSYRDSYPDINLTPL